MLPHLLSGPGWERWCVPLTWNHVASFGLTNKDTQRETQKWAKSAGQSRSERVGLSRVLQEVTEGGAAERRKEKHFWEWLRVCGQS